MISLYKFIANPKDVRFLLNGCIKFTPIPELNDPSELVPNVDLEAVVLSRDRLRREGYSEANFVHLQQQGALLQVLAPQHQAISVPLSKEQATAQIRSSFYNNTPLLEHLLNLTAEEISAKIGLFCLTERFDSLPMWAHYANNATGLVVEFRDIDIVFPGDNTGILRKPIPVRYERERVGVTFDPQSHESLFFAKFQDWSYEKEVRVVLPLAHCRRVQVNERQLHLFDIPKRHIARIVLGWRTAPEVVNSILDDVRSINPDVNVVQACIRRGKVHLGDRIYL